MKTVLRTMTLACTAIALAACALLAPLGKDDEARRAAKVTLAAYETTQQAILIYGRLPTCAPDVGPLCKDHDAWQKIKIVEKAASKSIAEATPVLNGSSADVGQLLTALRAIEAVKAAVVEAQVKLKAPKPAT